MHTTALTGCTANSFRKLSEGPGRSPSGLRTGGFSGNSRLVGGRDIRDRIDSWRGGSCNVFPGALRAHADPGAMEWRQRILSQGQQRWHRRSCLVDSRHRFAGYRDSISICRNFDEVKAGKAGDEDERRTAILRHCRNRLNDRSVEWLDAAVGIAADGSRSFAPVLGTGGNEGRLDYTNNFMSRIAALLISRDRSTPVRELLGNALFGYRTTALQPGAAGQYDPGRAGGANQGPGISHESTTNPWDLVLTLEGAVAWASGLYRRQGASYRAVLCSPFTVRASRVGYGSASATDDARGEIWTPLWRGPVRYEELKTLLREGRANVDGRPAVNALEFAEAACSLGVDRGIERFVRYSLLKRRGDSYVALPAGTFATKYRSEADRIRQFQTFLETLNWRELPRGAEELRRGVDAAIYQVLLRGGKERIRELMAALGRMLRRIAITSDSRLPSRGLKAADWLEACGLDIPEVRIAAALASIFARGVGSLADNLSRADKRFSWTGADLAGRIISVLERRLQLASSVESDGNPLGGACAIHPGDATSFIEGSVDDVLIEDLLFAFYATLDWQGLPSSTRAGKGFSARGTASLCCAEASVSGRGDQDRRGAEEGSRGRAYSAFTQG